MCFGPYRTNWLVDYNTHRTHLLYAVIYLFGAYPSKEIEFKCFCIHTPHGTLIENLENKKIWVGFFAKV